jgi:sigma-B regulation protein RsbU (phosphoserine phosphatase)
MYTRQSRSFRINPDETGEALDFLQASIQAFGVSEAVGRRVLTVLDEVISNVVRHAFGGAAGSFQVSVGRDQAGLVVEVADGGPPFNPLQREAPDTTAPLEARQAGGLGIVLVRALADDVRYERREGENRLTMIWRIGS